MRRQAKGNRQIEVINLIGDDAVAQENVIDISPHELAHPDILLSLSGLVISQPLSQSVCRRFESQR